MKRLLRLPLFWFWCAHPTVNLRVWYRCVGSSIDLFKRNADAGGYGIRLMHTGYQQCRPIERAFISWRHPEAVALFAEKGMAL